MYELNSWLPSNGRTKVKRFHQRLTWKLSSSECKQCSSHVKWCWQFHESILFLHSFLYLLNGFWDLLSCSLALLLSMCALRSSHPHSYRILSVALLYYYLCYDFKLKQQDFVLAFAICKCWERNIYDYFHI